MITDILDADATLLSVQSLVPGTEYIDELEFQADPDVDQYYENAADGATLHLADAPSADLTPFDFPFVDVEINLSSAP